VLGEPKSVDNSLPGHGGEVEGKKKVKNDLIQVFGFLKLKSRAALFF
jgi:hypothetical protein